MSEDGSTERGGRQGAPFDPTSFVRLNEVRKDLWAGGLKGLVVGLGIGSFGFLLTRQISSLKKYSHPNYFVSSILVCGSIGSFLGSTVAGKNSIQYIGDVFRINANPTSRYMKQMNENEQEIIGTNVDAFIRREQAIKKTKEISPKAY